MTELRTYVSLARDLRSGKVTPRAFLDECLDRIAKREPQIGAFVTLNTEGARKAADASTARWRDGKPLSRGRRHAARDQGRDRNRRHADRPGFALVRRSGVFTWREASGPRFARGRGGHHRQDHDHRIRCHPPVAQDQEPPRRNAHARRLFERLGRCRWFRHGAGSTWHPSWSARSCGHRASVAPSASSQASARINRSGSLRSLQPKLPGCDRRERWPTPGRSSRAITGRAGGDPGHVGASKATANLAKPGEAERLALLETGGWGATTEGARKAFRRSQGAARGRPVWS